MFDNVGKNNDAEATRRSFMSLMLSALMLGAGAAFVTGWGMYTAVQALTEPPPSDLEMVEVVIEDVTLEAAPPPPPPPPPAAAADEETEEDDTKETEEMVDEQKELKEDVSKEIKSEAREAGVKDGMEGGVKDGVKDGVTDGVKDGVLGGQLGGGIRHFHNSELEVKVKVTPDYPSAAESMNLGDQRCKVAVTIDEKGVPYQAVVTECPKIFHDAAEEALLKWRWYPPKAGKDKVKAQTLIAVVFKAR